MERVAFLIENSGERIACLLNPESLVLRRWSGVKPLRSPTGSLTAGTGDDPLILTGGGTTELRLDLLFDVGLDAATPKISDVRFLTKPLWDLTENRTGIEGRALQPVARFVWGKSWNIRGLVASMAERLEQFDALGNPGRSWLRMRFLRVPEPPHRAGAAEDVTLEGPTLPLLPEPSPTDRGEPQELVPAPSGEGGSDAALLPELAFRYFGNAQNWRRIAWSSGVDDPIQVAPGTPLRVPGQRRPEHLT